MPRSTFTYNTFKELKIKNKEATDCFNYQDSSPNHALSLHTTAPIAHLNLVRQALYHYYIITLALKKSVVITTAQEPPYED